MTLLVLDPLAAPIERVDAVEDKVAVLLANSFAEPFQRDGCTPLCSRRRSTGSTRSPSFGPVEASSRGQSSSPKTLLDQRVSALGATDVTRSRF